MKILIFSRHEHKIFKKIKASVKGVENLSTCFFLSRLSFKTALDKSFAGETLVVFFIHSEQDMEFLESVQADFVDIKLLIYFACRENSMISRAYRLYPRMVTGLFDSDDLLPLGINGVVANMVEALK